MLNFKIIDQTREEINKVYRLSRKQFVDRLNLEGRILSYDSYHHYINERRTPRDPDKIAKRVLKVLNGFKELKKKLTLIDIIKK